MGALSDREPKSISKRKGKLKRKHSTQQIDSYIQDIRNSVPLMLSPPTSNDTNSSLTSKDPPIKTKIKKSVYDLALDAAILNAENLAKQQLDESSSDSEIECKIRKRQDKKTTKFKNLINLSNDKYHKKLILKGRRFKNAVNFQEYKLAVNNG